MRRIHFFLMALAMLAGSIAWMVPASGQADKAAAPVYLTKMPSGFRDWQLISVAHEAGKLNSLGAMLGNEVAMKAYREKTLPNPDGTIIAALHYTHLRMRRTTRCLAMCSRTRRGRLRIISSW